MAHEHQDAVTEADRARYQLLTSLAAKGVAVITARDGRWDHAVTVTDYLSVSYDPPTLVVSLFQLARIADAVTGAGRFGLSLLTAAQRGVADRLGEPGTPLVGLLDHVPHTRRDPDGPPLLADTLAWFDVRVEAVHSAATHLLVVGRVEAMSDLPVWGAEPLVRWRSRYRM